MSLAWPNKDPDEILDYGIDWAPRLAGDTISSSTWIVPADLTGSAQANTTTTTTIKLAAGVLGKTYEVLNRVVTAGGRTMDQTATLEITSK